MSLKKLMSNRSIQYLIVITFGIYSGLSGNAYLQTLGIMLSDIFVNLFKCISLPIIALSIIVTLSNFDEQSLMPNIWRRTFLYTFTTTFIAASVAAIIYLIISPPNITTSIVTASNPSSNLSYLQHLSNLIPTNVLSPFLEHQVFSVLLMGITVGIAIRYIPDQSARKSVDNLFKGFYGIFFVITKWIVTILPIGLYGFITTTVSQLNHTGFNIEGFGKYLAVIVIANLIQGLIILPLWLKFNSIQPLQSFKLMFPALSIAFFSKSSAGALPITMDRAEQALKIDPKISRFVLPLCTTINMNGCAAFIFTTVIYLMQNHGIDITLPTIFLWITIATVAAVGNAGIPMGCFLLSASLLSSMNIPIVLLSIILPFYNIIDMIETTLNVWSDSCVANVVNRHFVAESQST